jgi:hypothetical protein
MFNKLRVQAAAFAMLALTASCGGSSSSSELALAATVDGAPFKATVVQVRTDSTFLTISGASLSQVMTLHVTVPTTPSTVALHDTSTTDYALLTEGNGTWSSAFGGSGTVTFKTTNKNEASGTFAFVAPSEIGSGVTSVRTVTNGTFTVRF